MSRAAARHPDAPRGDAVRLYLLRHGEPERRDLFYGHHDVALSPAGRAQAASQAVALGSSGVVAVYTSDLQRARYGAELVAKAHGLRPVVDPALREMHLGELENVPYAEGLANAPHLAGRSYRAMFDFAMPGGGESVRDVASRVLPLIEAVTVEHASTQRPGVVVYAHNTVTRLVLGQAAGVGPAGYGAFAQRYGAINRIDLRVSEGRVEWAEASIVYSNRDPERG